MGKLNVFNFISLDGYYKDASNGINWHQHGQEEGEFSAKNLEYGSILLFGRITYEMMASWWPSQNAIDAMPEVARGMNQAEKIVCTNTLQYTNWQNTRIMNGDIVAQIAELKKTSPKDIAILGSGNLSTQLAEAGLINTYQIMIDPVGIGKGTPIFNGMQRQLNLKLTDTRSFKSGTVLLSYEAL
ncbi:dihydrofolate reductase [Pedobacter sp. W3I1]|uniref:dihydrofolate reductase family protein n=1 Tax=Pedobacter sp. W3I1 TaxID=3042291 RepID=UPI002786D438|nr:dihydrofolate reductase family protein [Pedobacter sp. W3I1]MDQ0638749.1 dihydrofolate reductase [Pedobacter sp. W3I1]